MKIDGAAALRNDHSTNFVGVTSPVVFHELVVVLLRDRKVGSEVGEKVCKSWPSVWRVALERGDALRRS